MARTTSEVITSCRRVVCTSTIGVSPRTVSVSVTFPTRISALIVVTPDPVSSTPSRLDVENPLSENVTV
jgi:hypothetical protein